MAHPLMKFAPRSRSPYMADRSNPHLTSPLIVFPFSLFFSIPTEGRPVVSIKSISSGAHGAPISPYMAVSIEDRLHKPMVTHFIPTPHIQGLRAYRSKIGQQFHEQREKRSILPLGVSPADRRTTTAAAAMHGGRNVKLHRNRAILTPSGSKFYKELKSGVNSWSYCLSGSKIAPIVILPPPRTIAPQNLGEIANLWRGFTHSAAESQLTLVSSTRTTGNGVGRRKSKKSTVERETAWCRTPAAPFGVNDGRNVTDGMKESRPPLAFVVPWLENEEGRERASLACPRRRREKKKKEKAILENSGPF
ncbi:hypothetical protein JCGZ_08340 [Jatropha curcas]|uniref:Uncharacterized protein n=1 Tax=Jatropha curcas TaxID=180498 RepID=A0A067KNI4_JATCU|nr:hypothetical protein JCGZ_08340 [Jatropha curcas]